LYVVNHLKKKLLKYGILSFFGLAMTYQFIPIGDYCRGLATGLNFIFFAGLLILTFIIITISNLIKVYKKKEKFDFIPLILILCLGIFIYSIIGLENDKFWTKRTLIGIIKVDGSTKRGTLKLYENGSFGATYHNVDYSCTFQGNYEMNKNKLKLKRADINKLTENVFATEYIIDRKDSILKPINTDLKLIKIRKMAE